MNISRVNRSTVMTSTKVVLSVLALAVFSVAGAAERMTQEKAKEYFKRFNNEDVSYADFYTSDVVFPHIKETLHGPKQIIDFYKRFWAAGMIDIRDPKIIVIDNDVGYMVVEMENHISAKPGTEPETPSGLVIRKGEKYEGAATLIYGLRDGKISSIRGARSGQPVLVKP